jgi:hypothetical protein
MKSSANGRFCDSCQHEVFDFSDMSIEQIRAKTRDGVACGNFRVEQTEDLTPIEFTSLKKARYWIATIAAYFGLETTSLHAQHYRPEVKCEITGKCNDSIPNIRVENEIPVEVITDKEEPAPRFKSRRITTIGKYGIYRSKRFPFIRIRSRHIRGAYAFF